MSVLKIKNANNEWESVPVINGEDGVSPTITTSKVGRETTLTITDANGTHTATILDGADGSGSGDMSTSVYDTNNNGIVDNAEKVNNHTVQSDVPANAVFTDTTYTAGTGIAINNGVISNTQTSAAWGNITGTLSNQTDLQTALNNKADANDMPTKVSDLTNDSGFITSSSLPTKTSDLTNDSGFITDSYHDNTKQDTLVSGTNIKTINNESILGSGNITVSGGSSTDVQINGTSITSNNIADIITESSYNASTNKIATMSDIPNVPTKTSDLTNDSGFITSTVNNLTNYYTKTDTYTKTEVNNLINSISSLDIEVVQTLPSSDISTSTIYLLPKSSSGQQNIYDEYIYVNSSWELIGSTAIDLSNYYTSTQVDNLLSNKASKSLYSDTTINVGRKSNTTVGSSSTAEGIDTTASGTASHAEGEYTVANSKSQHVFGRYNISDTNDDNTDYGDYVEIVGNGDFNARSNARTLDWSGNETLAGGLTAGGDVVVGSIRTKNMLDGKNIIQGDIVGYSREVRLSSRQTIYLEPGTYTFSTNLSNNFDYCLWVENIMPPPTPDYPASYILNTGWVNGSTTTTFTIDTAGWFLFGFRKPDNSYIYVSDIISYNYQLEKGDTATDYTAYQNLEANANNINIYSKEEIKIGTWIDGRPLYCKVFPISSITSSNSNLVDISNMNIRDVVKVYGMLNTNNSQHFPMPLTDSSSNYSVIFATATVIRGRAVIGSGSFSSGWVALEYTKSTD